MLIISTHNPPNRTMHTTKRTAATYHRQSIIYGKWQTYQGYVVYMIMDASHWEEGGAEGRLGLSMDIKTGYNN